MIHWIAQLYAKWAFVWSKEVESGKHVWATKVAERNAALTKTLIAQMTKEADDMDARVKQMAEMEEKGFWECENGHETTEETCGPTPDDYKECDDCAKKPGSPDLCAACIERRSPHICAVCGKLVKLISRATMSGQEIYQSDKDRKEAEKLVAARREEITSHQKDLENQEQTARYFRGQAQSSRMLADNLRKV